MQKFNNKEQLTTSAKKGLANDIISGGKNPYPASAADNADDGDADDAVAIPGAFHSMHIDAHENGLSVRTEHKTKPKAKESFPSTNSMNHVFNNPDDCIKHVTKHIRAAYKK